MAGRPFSFQFSQSRYIKAGSLIYRFKIRGGSSFSEDEVLKDEGFDQQMEEIVRTVLAALDCLQPFSTPHYNVFPYKKRCRKFCRHHQRKLLIYPFIIIIYLQKKKRLGEITQETKQRQLPTVFDEPRPECSCRNSTLEEAIIEEIFRDMGTGCTFSVAG
ncbi:membrane-anchored junction protein [Cyprinodon tularosa]|uniref:membrane-anchored junction protein n=1 Tax=Cyprinodon tularosa TaxID=77115 RepID=UPI0018E24BC2|nr:membrane-anchored junction protein [Cyprinodon tularosa]